MRTEDLRGARQKSLFKIKSNGKHYWRIFALLEKERTQNDDDDGDDDNGVDNDDDDDKENLLATRAQKTH